MNRGRVLLIAFLAGLLACSCADTQRAEVAKEAKTSMIGMTKEQVLACMGAPAQQAVAGETEAWSYPSGGDTKTFGSATSFTNPYVPFGQAHVYGSSHSAHRYCVVSIVMAGGRVAAVNYTGRTGGWATQGEQCAFAIQNCVQSP
jgi:hypothetical protein